MDFALLAERIQMLINVVILFYLYLYLLLNNHYHVYCIYH